MLVAPRKSNCFAIVTGDTSVNGARVLIAPSAATKTLVAPGVIKSIAVCKHAGGYTVTLVVLSVPPDVTFDVNAHTCLEPPP